MGNKILTPEEWLKQRCGYIYVPTTVDMLLYADYVASERFKEDIKLPDYKISDVCTSEEYYNKNIGWNDAIDEIKELNKMK